MYLEVICPLAILLLLAGCCFCSTASVHTLSYCSHRSTPKSPSVHRARFCSTASTCARSTCAGCDSRCALAKYTNIHTCIYICIYIYININICITVIYIYIYTYIYVYAERWVHSCATQWERARTRAAERERHIQSTRENEGARLHVVRQNESVRDRTSVRAIELKLAASHNPNKYSWITQLILCVSSITHSTNRFIQSKYVRTRNKPYNQTHRTNHKIKSH